MKRHINSQIAVNIFTRKTNKKFSSFLLLQTLLRPFSEKLKHLLLVDNMNHYNGTVEICNFFGAKIECQNYWLISVLTLMSIGLPAFTLLDFQKKNNFIEKRTTEYLSLDKISKNLVHRHTSFYIFCHGNIAK